MANKPVQTRTIRWGALKFATQISHLLNFYNYAGLSKCSQAMEKVGEMDGVPGVDTVLLSTIC